MYEKKKNEEVLYDTKGAQQEIDDSEENFSFLFSFC